MEKSCVLSMASIPWLRVQTVRKRYKQSDDTVNSVNQAASAIAKRQHNGNHHAKDQLPSLSRQSKGEVVPWRPSTTPLLSEYPDESWHWASILLLISIGAVIAVACGCMCGVCIQQIQRKES